MKRLILLPALALVAASCASGTDVSADPTTAEPDPPSSTTTAVQPESQATDSTTTSSAADTPTTQAPAEQVDPLPPPEGRAAPDFTLALGEDGSESFTLSEGTKPVFMIFWAEW
jgi:hypothetical protein